MAAPSGANVVGTALERLRAFLRTLPPETCARVLEALERGNLAGQHFPGCDMIIGELVAVMADRQLRPPRLGNPKRHFFAVLDPFLIDEQLADKCAGRIARASLQHIWEWLCRDLVPDEMADYERDGTAALLRGETDQARALAGELQQALLPVMRAALASHDEVALRRFVVQHGGRAVLEDLRDMLAVIEHRDTLKALADQLGGSIRQLDEHLTAVVAQALAPFARGKAPLMPYAAAVVMWQLAHPWQILRVAVLAVESHEAVRLSQSGFAPVVDLLVCELERLVIRAAVERGERRIERVAVAATDFATYVRTILNELAMGPEVGWSKRMGTVRSRMAEVLRPELEDLPGRVRLLLRAPSRRELDNAVAFDARELESIETGLDFLLVVKGHATELALNEVTLRVVSRLHAFLEASALPLLDSLRGAAGAERAFRLQQLDGAVRIARRILGGNYATLLQRAVDVAAAEKPLYARAG